jgi:hypothetical protein
MGRYEIHCLHATKIRKVLTATANDKPEDEAATARRRKGEPDLMHDDDDGSRINRIGRLNGGAAPDRDRPLPWGARCGSGSG